MPGFTLTAAASMIAGLSIGAAATIGATAVAHDTNVVPNHEAPSPVASTAVQYGDRCDRDLCLPRTSTASRGYSDIDDEDRSFQP